MSLPHTAAPTEDEFPVGTSLCGGRFVVDAMIGRGGVATVYRVLTDRGEPIALKVMLRARAADPTQCERFDNEAKILRALGGVPYAVACVGAGRLPLPDGRPYIAMELLEGRTLHRLLNVGRVTARARVGRACRVLREVAHHVADLHRRGLIHRDIKPDNIVVEESGAVRLLDFGYAHSSGAGPLPDTAGLTRAEHRPGTYLYMAPEQVLGMPPAESFDVYALAVTLYEALVGRAPNQDLAVPEMARIKCELTEPELSITGRVFGMPPELEALVDHGLRREVADRIPSAAEFRDRLDEIVALVGSASSDETSIAETRESGQTAPAPFAAAIVDTERTPKQSRVEPAHAEPRSVSTHYTEVSPVAVPAPASRPATSSRSRAAWVPWLLVGMVTAAVALGWMLWPDESAVRADSQEVAGRDAGAGAGAVHVGAPPAPVEPVDTDGDGGTQTDTSAAEPFEPERPPDVPTEAEVPSPPAAEPASPKKPRPHTPRPRPCEDVASQAATAANARQWAKVLKLTRSSRCWDDQAQRSWLHVKSLMALGRYAECVKVGSRSSAPGIDRLVIQCTKKLDE